MYTTLMVGLGSALGGMARYACVLSLEWMFGRTFPWGTLFVNVTGSFVIGLFFALTAGGGRWTVAPDWRVFVTVGICGGYTTFSSFSLQTLTLLRDGHRLAAAWNVCGSLALCLAAVWLGAVCAALVDPRP